MLCIFKSIFISSFSFYFLFPFTIKNFKIWLELILIYWSDFEACEDWPFRTINEWCFDINREVWRRRFLLAIWSLDSFVSKIRLKGFFIVVNFIIILKKIYRIDSNFNFFVRRRRIFIFLLLAKNRIPSLHLHPL